MSAALNPGYWSKRDELNKYVVCSCGQRADKNSIRMVNNSTTCPKCHTKK